MSKGQTRRAGVPSKIAITVFADKRPEVGRSDLKPSCVQEDPKECDKPPLAEEIPSKRVRFEEGLVDKSPADTVELQQDEPLPQEVTCPKSSVTQKPIPTHGPMLGGLPPNLQQVIAKLHKNPGHPDSQQLQQALRRNGWSDVVIQAAKDVQCDVWHEKSQPKASRPAYIHMPREFNDLVTFDGVEWSDGKGNKYSCVHFVDTATNFQIAVPFFSTIH